MGLPLGYLLFNLIWLELCVLRASSAIKGLEVYLLF